MICGCEARRGHERGCTLGTDLDLQGRCQVSAKMTPGPCLWCGEYVTSEREEAGAPAATAGHDACWRTADGDFGCSESPETADDGVGDHARPWDAARWLIKSAALPELIEAARAVVALADGQGRENLPMVAGQVRRILARIDGEEL